MKRKILFACLCAILAVTTVLGSSIAYFSDTDSAQNIFALGKGISVDLVEYKRNDAGNGLIAVGETSGKKGGGFSAELTPILSDDGFVSFSQFADESFIGTYPASMGFYKSEVGYVDKTISLKNSCDSNIYTRCFVALPAEFDDSEIICINKNTSLQGWDAPAFAGYEIDGSRYNIYCISFGEELPPDRQVAITSGIYMDGSTVVTENADGTVTFTKDNRSVTVSSDYKYTVLAFAQGIQSTGFTSPSAAFSNLPANPWAD